MTLHYIWTRANPEYETYLARANEARAAAVWAALRPVRTALSWLAETASRTFAAVAERRRAHSVLAEVARLDDRQLADIGLTPADLERLASGKLPWRVRERRARTLEAPVATAPLAAKAPRRPERPAARTATAARSLPTARDAA